MSKDYDLIFEWLKDGGNLPLFLKDFHDQKDIFKGMHELYREEKCNGKDVPNWVDSHCYVIDFFLWYVGSRGYTLQKSRKKFEWLPFNMPTKARDLIMKGLNIAGSKSE